MNAVVQRGFEWEFLDVVSRWAVGVGVLAAALGTFLTRDVAFAVSCLLALAVDVGLVHIASRRAQHQLEVGHIDATAAIIIVGGRFIVKAALLTLSLLVPSMLSFAGTVTGVLTFDITLALVGSIIVLVRGFRAPGMGGDRRC